MQILNTKQRWGSVQKTLHWLVVLAVLCQLTVGFVFADLPRDDPSKGVLFGIHATIGMTILGLMLVRLLWRLINPVPELPDTLEPWQKRLARATHWLLYLILIGMPIGGYLMVSAHGHSVPFFWTQLPALIPKNEMLGNLILILHDTGAFVLIALVSLHIVGALRHAWLLKDGVLQRMLPARWSE